MARKRYIPEQIRDMLDEIFKGASNHRSLHT